MNPAMEQLKKRFVEKAEAGNKNHETLHGLMEGLQNADREKAYYVEDRLKEERAKTEAVFEKNLRKKSGLTSSLCGPEIRARLHGMEPGDKARAIQEILKSGDGGSVAAITEAPGVLTGLKSDEIARIKSQHYRQTAPELMAAKENYDALVNTVSTAIQATIKAAGNEE